MKTLIEDCKERELEKEQLLLKIKQKEDKIKELQMRSEKSPRDMDFSKMKEEMKKLREENERLNQQQVNVSIVYSQSFRKSNRWRPSFNRCILNIREL